MAEPNPCRQNAALAGLRLMHAGRRLQALAAKANFNPGQPRVPRGNVDGGRWTRIPGAGLPVVRVQATPRPPGRFVVLRRGVRLENPTPAQIGQARGRPSHQGPGGRAGARGRSALETDAPAL